MSTQQDQVVGVANQLLNITAQLWNISQQINVASAAWTNLGVAAKLNLFPTAPATATGGLGTADGSPVVTDPIDTRVAPGSSLSVAISPNNIAAMLTFLQGVSTAIGGGAVSANGAAVQLVALTH